MEKIHHHLHRNNHDRLGNFFSTEKNSFKFVILFRHESQLMPNRKCKNHLEMSAELIVCHLYFNIPAAQLLPIFVCEIESKFFYLLWLWLILNCLCLRFTGGFAMLTTTPTSMYQPYSVYYSSTDIMKTGT